MPLLKDPSGTVKDFAVTQIARCCSGGCKDQPVEEVDWHRWEVCRCVRPWLTAFDWLWTAGVDDF